MRDAPWEVPMGGAHGKEEGLCIYIKCFFVKSLSLKEVLDNVVYTTH